MQQWDHMDERGVQPYRAGTRANLGTVVRCSRIIVRDETQTLPVQN